MGRIKQLNKKLKEKYLGEMATLKPKVTGINGITLYCSPEMGSHWIRVKAYDKTANISTRKDPHIVFSVGLNPEEKDRHGKIHISNKDIAKIKEWIYNNQVVLTDYWHKRSDTEDLLNNLIKYGEK